MFSDPLVCYGLREDLEYCECSWGRWAVACRLWWMEPRLNATDVQVSWRFGQQSSTAMVPSMLWFPFASYSHACEWPPIPLSSHPCVLLPLLFGVRCVRKKHYIWRKCWKFGRCKHLQVTGSCQQKRETSDRQISSLKIKGQTHTTYTRILFRMHATLYKKILGFHKQIFLVTTNTKLIRYTRKTR